MNSLKDSKIQKPTTTTDLKTGVGDWLSRHPFLASLACGLLLFAAFPPIGFWPFAWIAPGFLITLTLPQRDSLRARDYGKIWVGGLIHWLLMNYYVTLPHWAGYFGWVAMSAYGAVYFPLFVLMTRGMIRALKFPVATAAAIGWVSVELLRAHLVTGYGMAMLPHSMFKLPMMIQTADLVGGYGLSFLMILVTASFIEVVIGKKSIHKRGRYFLASRLAVCVGVVGLILGYGFINCRDRDVAFDQESVIKVALIQGSIDTIFPKTEAEAEKFYLDQFEQYCELTREARRDHKDLDLIVWPESMFPIVYFESQQTDLTHAQKARLQEFRGEAARWFRIVQGSENMHADAQPQPEFSDSIRLLTGANVSDPVTDDVFNGALLFEANGDMAGSYYKNHRVPFGEYAPMGDWFPWIYDMMPIGQPLTPGKHPKSFMVDELRLAPSICFESTVSRLIIRHVNELEARGEEPDVLVNLTNDGWFYGSNCLDLHLACNVFRSVEVRKPTMIAANTGFSGLIDANGRIIKQGPRRMTEVLVVNVGTDCIRNKRPIYRAVGEYPAIGCLIVSIFGLIGSVRNRKWQNAT